MTKPYPVRKRKGHRSRKRKRQERESTHTQHAQHLLHRAVSHPLISTHRGIVGPNQPGKPPPQEGHCPRERIEILASPARASPESSLAGGVCNRCALVVIVSVSRDLKAISNSRLRVLKYSYFSTSFETSVCAPEFARRNTQMNVDRTSGW